MSLYSIITTTSSFLNTYPVCPPILLSLLTIGLIPISLLIYLVQQTAVHSNCRYLITAWCLSFWGMFLAHYGIVSLNIVSEKGFFPDSMFEPMTRQLCYAAHVVFFVCCSSFEVVIAMERVISSINPMRYSIRSFDFAPLTAVTLFIISIAVLLSYWMYGEDHRSLGCVFLLILDTGTVKLNFYAVRYCSRRYGELYGKAELNARYQVKEAHTMAVAMRPVYIASYVIKFAVNFTCIFFFFFENAFTLLTGYIEFAYTTVVAINGALTTGLLIRSHPRIKQRYDEAKTSLLPWSIISSDSRCPPCSRFCRGRQHLLLYARTVVEMRKTAKERG